MNTDKFISTIFGQINSELSKGAKFERLHLCKLQNIIAVRGRKHSSKNHFIIHEFTKREISHGFSKDEWLKLIRKINSVKKSERFFNEKTNQMNGEFDLEKWFTSEQNRTEAVNRDVNIVNYG